MYLYMTYSSVVTTYRFIGRISTFNYVYSIKYYSSTCNTSLFYLSFRYLADVTALQQDYDIFQADYIRLQLGVSSWEWGVYI